MQEAPTRRWRWAREGRALAQHREPAGGVMSAAAVGILLLPLALLATAGCRRAEAAAAELDRLRVAARKPRNGRGALDLESECLTPAPRAYGTARPILKVVR